MNLAQRAERTARDEARFEAAARWFAENRGLLPEPPYELRLGHRIVSTQFYRALEADIAEGPRGPRGRYGAVLQDLADLYRVTQRLLTEPRLGAGWCPGCSRVCPGWDAEGFCLLADREEIARRTEDWR